MTVIRALSATRSVTWTATNWNVWVADERRAVLTSRDDAVDAAIVIAHEVGRPAWVRVDANHPWEAVPL